MSRTGNAEGQLNELGYYAVTGTPRMSVWCPEKN
jgi:hypothetical protein